MATEENFEDWERLARLLIDRRVQLGYPKRTEFARQAGLTHDRTLSDLENARRTNYDAATFAQMEQLYQWTSGSIRAVLAGGDPTIQARSSETVSADDQDPGVLLSLPSEALEGLGPMEREEAITAAKLALLEKAREIRRRLDE